VTASPQAAARKSCTSRIYRVDPPQFPQRFPFFRWQLRDGPLPSIPFAETVSLYVRAPAMLALRLGLAALILSATLGGLLIGDDKKDDPKKDDPKDPTPVPKGTLPKNFKSLGLDDKQKKDIYRIEAEYRAKIDDYQTKIAELKKDEKSEIEKVLTKAQKDLLREIREKEINGDKTPPKDPPVKDPPKDPAK
jgi:hypothetical protein